MIGVVVMELCVQVPRKPGGSALQDAYHGQGGRV